MKNSAYYARKIRRLLSGSKKTHLPEQADGIPLLVTAVLSENATNKQTSEAMARLVEEFVDFNELRVSPVKDVVECLGREFPGARLKAEAVTRALNVVFGRTNSLSLEYLAPKPKRELRKTLREELGLSPYAESFLTLHAFQGHAVPVDSLLLEALKLDKYIHLGSDLADLQGFLERIVLSKDGASAHEALRSYASKTAGRVAKELARRAKRAAAAAARVKAEQEAKEKAEADAKAEAEAKAKARKRKPVAKKAGRRKVRKAAARKARKPVSRKAAKKSKRTKPAAGARKSAGKRAKK